MYEDVRAKKEVHNDKLDNKPISNILEIVTLKLRVNEMRSAWGRVIRG